MSKSKAKGLSLATTGTSESSSFDDIKSFLKSTGPSSNPTKATAQDPKKKLLFFHNPGKIKQASTNSSTKYTPLPVNYNQSTIASEAKVMELLDNREQFLGKAALEQEKPEKPTTFRDEIALRGNLHLLDEATSEETETDSDSEELSDDDEELLKNTEFNSRTHIVATEGESPVRTNGEDSKTRKSVRFQEEVEEIYEFEIAESSTQTEESISGSPKQSSPICVAKSTQTQEPLKSDTVAAALKILDLEKEVDQLQSREKDMKQRFDQISAQAYNKIKELLAENESLQKRLKETDKR